MPAVSSDTKRKLDVPTTESAKSKKGKTINSKVLETMVDVKIDSDNRDDGEQVSAVKRRRKAIRSADSTDDQPVRAEPDSSMRLMALPQKKRALPSPNRSPSRKTSKLEDDEILIRETEAALKSLSGSYTGPREEDKFEQPHFENLFEEKKTVQNKPPQVTNSAHPNVDLKDVITFRESNGKKMSDAKKTKKDEKNGEKFTPRYEPDFNELVDDSSTEMEMTMEEGKREKKTLGMAPQSAFRSPGVRGSIDSPAIPPIGPFPASATFVGYPPASGPVAVVPKPEPEKPVEPIDGKQYTILQPAGAGSRAATVMEDIARDGVLSVPAVSSSSAAERSSPPSSAPCPAPSVVTAPAPITPRPPPPPPPATTQPAVEVEKPTPGPLVTDSIRPLGSLSPASLSRGGEFLLFSYILVPSQDNISEEFKAWRMASRKKYWRSLLRYLPTAFLAKFDLTHTKILPTYLCSDLSCGG